MVSAIFVFVFEETSRMCSLFVCLLPSHPGTRENLLPQPIACGKGIFFVKGGGGGWVVGGVVLGKRIQEFNSRGL